VIQEFAFALRGCEVSCGVLLAVAGAGKAYRGIRRIEADTAVRRVLRIPRRVWRYAELAFGLLECGIGACVLVWPGGAGVAMAVLGAAFCVLLGYARAKRIPGGCGCLGWRTPMSETITWRAIARGGMLLAVGAASAGVALALAGTGAGAPGTFRDAWCYAGMLAGGAILALLSMTAPVRTPACRRPLWRPVRATVRALAGHEIFAAMAAAEGPFAPEARYRRTGCTEEFWFLARAGDAVVFQVRHLAPGRSLAVHAARGGPSPGPPGRIIRVPNPPAPLE
jgi:methylamine utilization protein MauE